MYNELRELKNKIRLLPDNELVRMLTLDRDQYLKDALDFADGETRSRGLDINAISNAEVDASDLADLTYEEEKSKGLDIIASSNVESEKMFGKKKKGSKIGGLLILFAIGMVISPFIFLYMMYAGYSVLSDPSYSKIFTEFPFKHDLIIIDTIFNTVYFGFSIYIAIYFFKRDSRFPKMIIAFEGTYAIFVTLIYFIRIDANGESDYSGFKDTLTSIIRAAIWITYFKKSKRVKSTFVTRPSK